MKKTIIFLFITFSLVACNNVINQEHASKETNHHKEEKHHHGHSANEHMHKRPVEELIKEFESAERDAYQKPDKVLKYLGDISTKKIIDIGTGSGYFAVKLAAQDAEVIAADVSDEFLVALDKRITENNLNNIETRKIPYDEPGLAPEEVDMVLIINTYHHIEDRSTYFNKVKAGTKTTGELVIIDFFKTEVPVGPPVNHKISIDQVIAELKRAGYTSFVVNVDLLPYQFIIKAN